MRARSTRAAVVLLVMLPAGLGAGLALGDSLAPQSQTAISARSSAVPVDQAGVVRSQAVTSAVSGVPATTVGQTATDVATELSTQMATVTVGPAVTVAPQVVRPAPVRGAAVGNAANAATGDKRREAVQSCRAKPAPTNPLLSVGSTVSGRPRRSLVGLPLTIAVAAAAVAILAIVLRRRRSAATGARTPRTALELVSSSVAILGTLATIAVAYLGAGVKDHPPPSIRMTVREVHARITRGAYMDKMGGVVVAAPQVPAAELATAHAATLDRLEIGNVVWLELDLTGYRNTTLDLQWALFHAGPGQPLIPGSEQIGALSVDDRSDVHTEFLPIWVGSPRVPRYRAEFRVLDHGQVRQIASTGPMQGIAYRYAC